MKRDAEIRRLRAALRASDLALQDWLHSYAGDQCSERSVAKTELRIFNAGGLLAYLAKLCKANREALK